MSAIVGVVNVNSLAGVCNIGDVNIIAPKTIIKTYAGGGSFSSGTNLRINNERSVINVYESGASDQNFFIENESELAIKGRT